MEDFESGDKHASSFVAYVKICLILGDLCEEYQQQQQLAHLRADIKGRLYAWLKALPPEMQYFSSRAQIRETADNFTLRQIFAIYLTTVALLCKADPVTTSVSAVAVLASSFLASLMEGFLARNEFTHLPAIVTFFILAGTTPHLAARKYQSLRPAIELDLQIFEDSLFVQSKKWPTAANAWTSIKALRGKTPGNEATGHMPSIAEPQDLLLFEDFDLESCRTWSHIVCMQNDSQLQDTSYGFTATPRPPPVANTICEVFSDSHQRSMQPLTQQRDSNADNDFPEDELWPDPGSGLTTTLGTWLLAEDSWDQCETS